MATSPQSAPAETRLTIRARGVTKKFGDFAALQNLDLDVQTGECVGLLGPNGAGKSTFIGCLYGAVARTSGELQVFGFDPSTDSRQIKERLGVVPQENALDEGLTVLENMVLYARFEGLYRDSALKRIDELLAHMSLDHKRQAPIRSLSGGMKRRLAFVRALLSDPEFLILDEPTTGLDPTVRHLLWDKVLSYRQAGRTVLVSTHYMHEAESLCDRIVILNKGAIIDSGAPRELITQHAPGFVAMFPRGSQETLKPFVDSNWQMFEQGHQTCVRAPRLEDLTEFQHRSNVLALQMRPSNLEDVYLKLTGKELGDDE